MGKRVLGRRWKLIHEKAMLDGVRGEEVQTAWRSGSESKYDQLWLAELKPVHDHSLLIIFDNLEPVMRHSKVLRRDQHTLAVECCAPKFEAIAIVNQRRRNVQLPASTSVKHLTPKGQT